MAVLGMMWLPLRVGGVKENHKLYVAPGLCNQLILGKDWLEQNRTQLTFNPPPPPCCQWLGWSYPWEAVEKR